MTLTPPTEAGRRTTRQFLLTAVAAGGMTAGLAVYFFVEPLTVLTIAIAALLLAVGVAVGVVALYRATRLISDGGPLRTMAWSASSSWWWTRWSSPSRAS